MAGGGTVSGNWRDLKPSRLKFTLAEFSGGLGDLGLFIPLVVGMVIAADLDLGMILICAGLMNILSGWLFRQPIPVQPMKAIAVVVITEGLVAGEIVASGILIGILMLALAFSGLIDRINGHVPKAIVRGIQFGLGIKLALAGLTWIAGLSLVGWDSITVAVIIIGIILIFQFLRKPIILYLFLAGFVVLYFSQPGIYASVGFTLPKVSIHLPGLHDWFGGALYGTIPQLPLTLLNSVIAVCALSSDYFPGRGLAPKRVAISVSLMNLLSVPFGGIPMCHGSGGLAAQYRFGARTGGSVIMLGALKVIAGLFFGGTLVALLNVYPMAILGSMLAFAGIELARSVKDVAGWKEIAAVGITALFILLLNTGAGFIAGVGIIIIQKLFDWAWKKYITRGPVEGSQPVGTQTSSFEKST